ncbi:MAG: DUF4124 domain-containing protein [Gammaproteobacteria bacterium]|nr:DUF4124 domain-containing protein [Gammaproteobacteria bacterium]
MKRPSAPVGSLVLCIAWFAASTAVAQESSVYKWVDAQGVPHFSDQPPPDSSAEELAIRFRRTDKAALQARVEAESELDAAAAVREDLTQTEAAAAKADRRKVLAEREVICAAARDRMANYGRARRLYKPGPDGERIYLTDEELDVERANASRAVDQACSRT